MTHYGVSIKHCHYLLHLITGRAITVNKFDYACVVVFLTKLHKHTTADLYLLLNHVGNQIGKRAKNRQRQYDVSKPRHSSERHFS